MLKTQKWGTGGSGGSHLTCLLLWQRDNRGIDDTVCSEAAAASATGAGAGAAARSPLYSMSELAFRFLLL